MSIKLSIVLSGPGGELDRTELEFDHEPEGWSPPRVQQQIINAIAQWELHPGDVIVIEGNEEAFNTGR